MGDIRFGKNGEWTKSGMLQVQYHDITDAANLETWRGMSYQTVVTPADQKTGNLDLSVRKGEVSPFNLHAHYSGRGLWSAPRSISFARCPWRACSRHLPFQEQLKRCIVRATLSRRAEARPA